MPNNTEIEPIKKPNQKSDFSQKHLLELMLCIEDPLYFIENFVQIQHSMKGSILFVPFYYQRDMIKAFHKNRFVCALTARQMGKCVSSNINVLRDGKYIKIGSLIKLNFKEKIIDWIENKIITLLK